MPRVTVLFAALMVAACSTEPSDSHVPQLGRYDFHAEWAVPEYPIPAVVDGVLTISAASETEATWSLVTEEANNTTETHNGTDTWSELNDYLILGVSVGRAGFWNLIPHLKRTGSEYECSGVAITNTYPPKPSQIIHSAAMTCTWTFLGP